MSLILTAARRGVWLLIRVLALGVLSLSVPAAEAQLTRGTISGAVTDASGAVLPGVRVTITNQDTGLVRSATVSNEGLYRVPALEPGMYTVRFELDGFRTAENTNIPVKTRASRTWPGPARTAPVHRSARVVLRGRRAVDVHARRRSCRHAPRQTARGRRDGDTLAPPAPSA